MAATVLDGEALARRFDPRSPSRSRARKVRSDSRPWDDSRRRRRAVGPLRRDEARDCTEVGMNSVHAHLPADVSQEDLLATVRFVQREPEVDAYLIQLPLPKHLDEEKTLLAVDPDKDVDGLHR